MKKFVFLAKKSFRSTLFVMLCGVSLSSWADGIEQLKSFVNQVSSARGQFVQTQLKNQQVGKQIAVSSTSSGYFEFLRPGKFIWSYEKPYKQLLQSDGKKLYVYDEDLQQVTIMRLDQALDSSPAAVLFGQNNILKHYQVQNLPSQEGVDWVQLIPKSTHSQFNKINLGFQKGRLVSMQLFDAFGQVTDLMFNNFIINPIIHAKQFYFVIPKNVTVAENG